MQCAFAYTVTPLVEKSNICPNLSYLSAFSDRYCRCEGGAYVHTQSFRPETFVSRVPLWYLLFIASRHSWLRKSVLARVNLDHEDRHLRSHSLWFTRMENRKRVAFLGPPSSFTHQAAVESFSNREYRLESQLNIPDVFHAVQSSEADFGVVPLENSSNGSVLYTLDCLIDRDKDFSDITVCGEAYMDVQHCLVGYLSHASTHTTRDPLSPTSSGQATPTTREPTPKKPRSQPLVDVQHVTDIYSHPQAFGQSQRFLSTYLKGAKHHEVSSTSKAAETVAEKSFASAAAISSKLAGELNGLTLLANDIQDREDNTTRFLILRRNHDLKPPDPAEREVVKDFKALISFTVDHRSPGALANALQVFAKEQLNLTNFNSRPSRLRPWHYIFLVECQSTSKQNLVKSQIEHTLEVLKTTTEDRRCLGHWQEKSVPQD